MRRRRSWKRGSVQVSWWRQGEFQRLVGAVSERERNGDAAQRYFSAAISLGNVPAQKSLPVVQKATKRYVLVRCAGGEKENHQGRRMTHALLFHILGELVAGLQLFLDHALDVLELRPSTLRFFGGPFHVLERRRRPVRSDLV